MQFLNFIKGFSDGLILPFVCITALLQATHTSKNYIYITGSVIIIFSVIHAISYYLTQKAHISATNNTKSFTGIGLSTEVEKNILLEHEAEKKAWQMIIQNNPFDQKQAISNALFTGLGYLLAGILLIAPFFIYLIPIAYKISLIACFICIVFSSYYKTKFLPVHFFELIVRSLFYIITLSVMSYLLVGLFLK